MQQAHKRVSQAQPSECGLRGGQWGSLDMVFEVDALAGQHGVGAKSLTGFNNSAGDFARCRGVEVCSNKARACDFCAFDPVNLGDAGGDGGTARAGFAERPGKLIARFEAQSP